MTSHVLLGASFQVGGPLCKKTSGGTCRTPYASLTDAASDQRALYEEHFYTPLEESLFAHFGVEHIFLGESAYSQVPWKDGPLEVNVYAQPLNNLEFTRMTFSDFSFVGFAFLFVWAWVRFHTGHWFLAMNAMGQVRARVARVVRSRPESPSRRSSLTTHAIVIT